MFPGRSHYLSRPYKMQLKPTLEVATIHVATTHVATTCVHPP